MLHEFPGMTPEYVMGKLPLHIFLRLLQLANKSADAERTRNDAEWMQQEREKREHGARSDTDWGLRGTEDAKALLLLPDVRKVPRPEL